MIKDNLDKALDYYTRAHTICENNGNKGEMVTSLNNIGVVYYNKSNYDKAEEYLKKSLAIQKEIGGKAVLLETTIYLYLTYRYFGKEYDIKEIHFLIQEPKNIIFQNNLRKSFELNFRLYQLLEDTSYLETAYNQVQERAHNLEPDVAAKFLSYPIPAAIVNEWGKVK